MLIEEDADEDHSTGNGITQGGGVTQEVYHVAQHDEDSGADQDSDDRTLAATQAATAQYRGGNGVEFKERAV